VRTLFLALLLANVVLGAYAWWRQSTPGPQTEIASQQIAPERMRIITAEEAEAMSAARRGAPMSCIEWGAFALADVPKAIESIEVLGVKARERRLEEPGRWWVMLPPLATRAAATARLAELKKLGVEDIGVIDDEASGFRNGISLGLYRSEEGARTRVDGLAKRGVDGARVVPREAVVRVYLQVREAPEGFRSRAGELKSAWPAAELRDCPPEARS
jgi:hypothetical protein